MSALSDFLEDDLIDHFASDTRLPLYDTWVALYTSDPTDADTGTEVSGGSYARQQVHQDGATSPFWEQPTADNMQNQSEIAFPQATADWGTVSHVGIKDSDSGGSDNLLFHGSLSSSKTVTSGDTFKFAAGDLDVTFA